MLTTLVLATALATIPPCIPIHKHHVQHPKTTFIEKTCVILPPTPQEIPEIVLRSQTHYVLIETGEAVVTDCAPPVVWHDVTYWPIGGGYVGGPGWVQSGGKPPRIGGLKPNVPPQPYHTIGAKAPELDTSSGIASVTLLAGVLILLEGKRK